MVKLATPYRLGLCVFALSSLMIVGAAPMSVNFDQRILVAQNFERTRLGLEPLRWNPDLAADAAVWANRLASSHRFEHAPENNEAPEGENLWEGTRHYYPAEAMVDAWVREKKYFKPGIFPNNSTTGNVEDVGHFTQIAWRNTTEVGCATAANADNDVLVCRYSQAGNYVGQRPF